MNIGKNVKIGSDDSNNNETVKKLLLNKKLTITATGYLTSDAKATFIPLKKAFTKASMFCHFDPKYYIQIETSASSYAICVVLN